MAVPLPFRLTGKVALVTGSARGIGQAAAIGLAEAGADVFLVDQLNAAETALQIESLGRKCLVENRDLANLNDKQADKFQKELIKSWGFEDEDEEE